MRLMRVTGGRYIRGGMVGDDDDYVLTLFIVVVIVVRKVMYLGYRGQSIIAVD